MIAIPFDVKMLLAHSLILVNDFSFTSQATDQEYWVACSVKSNWTSCQSKFQANQCFYLCLSFKLTSEPAICPKHNDINYCAEII